MFQAGVCIRHMEHLVKEFSANSISTDPAVFLCGDFNSTPECGVLEYMRKGVIEKDHAEWNSWEGLEIKDLVMRHPYKMDTACGTPKYTNYTIGFKDCLDYIFYQTDLFEVTEVVPFPSTADLEQLTAIPNKEFPSDHIACVATLKWKDGEKK